ncbi:MAG: hypothetical protein EP329_21420 [Deltaproteobacteria bacterium]|nr:MAG: hypothetical protein EP329_21420 [Deltaproteobacteria bacterium]
MAKKHRVREMKPPVEPSPPATGAWERATRALALPEVRLSWPWVVLLVVAAWAFGFVVRLLWLPGAEANPQAVFDGHVTPTVTDGYFWAAGVQQAVEGVNAGIRRIPELADHAIVLLGALGAQLTSIQDAVLYLPALIAPLVAAPLVVLGRLLGAPYWGAVAGLLSAVGWSYYSRTLMGYFDTDMFAVTVLLVLVVAMIASVLKLSAPRAFFAAGLVAVAPFFYDQIGPVLIALGGLFGVYLLVFHRRDAFAWPAIAAISIALLPLPWWARLALLAGVWAVLQRDLVPTRYRPLLALALALAVVVTSPVLHKILGELTRYTDRGTVGGEGAGEIAFMRVGGLVREMARLDFAPLAARFAGSPVGVVLALVGYVLACLRYRPLLLLLPLVALGVFSLWGGLRFTIYAVPVAALGLGYLVALVATTVSRRLPDVRARVAVAVVAMLAMTAPVLASQAREALERAPYAVVDSGEADLMTRFGRLAEPGAYAIAWWDFGYPLYYYAHVGALIDGGKHGHDNLVASQVMLTRSQRQAANLSRVAVERFAAADSPYKPVIDGLFADARAAGSTPRAWLASLAEPGFVPPAKTREVYLYLPHKMLRLLGAVEQFSRDARRPEATETPAKKGPYFVYTTTQKAGGKLQLGKTGLAIDAKTLEMTDQQGRPVSVRSYDLVALREDGTLSVKTQAGADDGRMRVIFLKSHGAVVVCDEETYGSTLVQLLVLGREDPTLFEPVLRTPYGAVFRVLR